MRTQKGHHSHVNSAAYSQDGRSIITASGDNTAKIWNTESGECIHTLEGHGSEVNKASYNTDGEHIVSVSSSGSITIWRAESGSIVKSF